MRRTAWLAAVTVTWLVATAIAAPPADTLGESFFDALDHPAIQYKAAPVRDRVALLNRRIQQGEVQLKYEGFSGYLRSVLEALEVPVESQLVVFSKTSVQGRMISPSNPRAIYFNDSVAIGWPRFGFIEIAAHDPTQGVIFYLLPQRSEAKPAFVRNDSCLTCHHSYAAVGVPGMLVRSIVTLSTGDVAPQLGNYISDHRSRFEERWGGWYVTGKPTAIRHLGNVRLADRSAKLAAGTILESLADAFDTGGYLSPYSDIVALMVFEHQMHMMNLLTRFGWEARLAASGGAQAAASGLLRAAAANVADYLLFVDEPPLPAKVQGTSGFAAKFAEQGPRDDKGRSLRQLDLERRLMRYPCSYMIYSAAFDALPVEARDAIYRRLWEILSRQDPSPKYARLSLADRRAIVEILRATKPGLPDSFKPIAR